MSKGTVVLSAFSLTTAGDRIRFRCSVDGNDGWPTELWVEHVGGCDADDQSTTASWAVVGLLYPAMALGKDLESSKAISERLLYNLNGDIQSVLIGINPSLSRIRVRAPVLTRDAESSLPRRHGVATGYSAGVDSFTTLALLSPERTTPGMRLTHLTVHNVGAMGTESQARDLFRRYLQRAQAAAGRMGFGAIGIDSNLDSFYRLSASQIIGYQPTHTLRGASAALTCEHMLATYHYSSSYSFRDIRVAPAVDTAYAEPILLPMLSTERLTFFSTGSSLRRLDKAFLVSDFPASYRELDICVGDPIIRATRAKPNCGLCWKCMRHLLTLDLIGKLDEYAEVFDISTYRRMRPKVIGRVLARAMNPTAAATADKEVIEELKARWGAVPRRAKIEALVPPGGRLERLWDRLHSRPHE